MRSSIVKTLVLTMFIAIPLVFGLTADTYAGDIGIPPGTGGDMRTEGPAIIGTVTFYNTDSGGSWRNDAVLVVTCKGYTVSVTADHGFGDRLDLVSHDNLLLHPEKWVERDMLGECLPPNYTPTPVMCDKDGDGEEDEVCYYYEIIYQAVHSVTKTDTDGDGIIDVASAGIVALFVIPK